MLDRTSLADLPPDLARLVDQRCMQFEEALKSGQRPRIDDFLSDVPGDAQAILRAELAALESVYHTILPESDAQTLSLRSTAKALSEGDLPSTLPDGGPPMAGEQFPRISGFEILGKLGQGGMGVVYKARHIELKRLVALKMIRAAQDADAGQLARFRTEAEAVARLQHPNIVQIHEIGQSGGNPFFVLEYVEGGSLAARLNGALQPPREAAQLVETLARAIAFAHQHGVIHRDLKPANILLAADGTPKIADFGLAKKLDDDSGQTHTGVILGTPSYMAPEQATGDTRRIGPLCDVYALGAILYELLTGRPPFRGATPVETIDQVRTTDPVPPSRLQPKLPRDVETICLKCLDKDPIKRYPSANDLADELQRYLSGQPIRARPLSRASRAWRTCRRYPLVTSLAATAVALLMLSTAVSTLAYFREAGLKRIADIEKSQALLQKNETERQARDSRLQQLRAERQRRVATAQRLATHSQTLRTSYPIRSALLAMEAVNTTVRHGELVVPAAKHELRSALQTIGGTPVVGPGAFNRALAISPDGHWLVTTSWETKQATGWGLRAGNAVQLWDLTSRDPTAAPISLPPHEDDIEKVAFSADSHWLVTTSIDATRLWDLSNIDSAVQYRALRGHDGAPVSSSTLAIAANGRWLVMAGGPVLLWDLENHDQSAAPKLLRGHEGGATAIAISPNSRWLVTAYDDPDDETARLWDLSKPDPTAESKILRGHEDGIAEIAISEDSKWLVTLTGYKATLWSLDEADLGAKVAILGDAETAAISPDGHWLVAAPSSSPAPLSLWDLHDVRQKPTFLLSGHEDLVSAMAISSDSRWLVTGSDDKTARVWDLHSPDPAATPIVLRGHEGAIRAVAISNQCVVTSSEDKTSRLWFFDDGSSELMHVLRGHDGNVSFTGFDDPSISEWLVTSGDDGTVRLWNMSERLHLAEPKVLGRTVISADGRWLYEHTGVEHTWASKAKQEFDCGKVYDLNSADFSEREIRLRADTTGARGALVAISADGRWLVKHGDVTGKGKVARPLTRWDLQNTDPAAKPAVLAEHQDTIDILTISPDSRWLIVAGKGQVTRPLTRWDLQNTDPAAKPAVLAEHQDTIDKLTISPDSRWLVVVGRDNVAWLWDLKSPDPAPARIELYVPEDRIMKVAISADSRWVVTLGSYSRTFGEKTTTGVQLWDLTSPDPAAAPRVFPNQDEITITDIAISADARWLVIGGTDNTAQAWDLKSTVRPATPLVLRGHQLGIQAIAFSSDGRWLVTGSDDSTARLWNLQGPDVSEESHVLRGHSGAITRLVMSPCGRWLVTLAGGTFFQKADRTARIWDLHSPNPAADPWLHDSFVRSGVEVDLTFLPPDHHQFDDAAFSPNGHWLVTWSAGVTNIWCMRVEDLLDAARRATGRELTPEERRQYQIDER